METIIALLGPLHPPLVHFAVACPILAIFAVAAMGIFHKEWLGPAAAALWVAAFLAAFAAGITGHLFSLHLGLESSLSFLPPEKTSHGVLREHAMLGSLALLLSFSTLWAAVRTFQERPLSWKVQFILGLLLALAVGLAGHEGGEMVYAPEGDEGPVVAGATPGSFSTPAGTKTPSLETNAGAQQENTGDLISLARGYRQTLVRMNTRPWNSRAHGHRWVNTYVSPAAVEAYQNSDTIPEGSLVVKESFEDADNKPSETPGPLYVMFKGPVHDSPRTGGWRYALEWDHPVTPNPEHIQMPVRWLPGDPHLNSCVKCHRHFKIADYLGGVPDGFEKP